MKFGSLFSGIGGIDLGLERAGMKCAWQVEIDQFCRKVLEKHWPDVERFEDVRGCGKGNLEPVDLVCGGFPCQPHSVAGKQRGAGDNRDLWPEYFRIIRELRPRWILGENVPGIRTTMLDKVLFDLETEGYTAITLDIPAIAFDAPHRRQRYFIVAYSDVEGLQNWRYAREPEGKDEKVGQVAQSESKRCGGSWWAVEPDVGRMVNGFPGRVDRIRVLGNAVVPQVAEWVGRRIVVADRELQSWAK